MLYVADSNLGEFTSFMNYFKSLFSICIFLRPKFDTNFDSIHFHFYIFLDNTLININKLRNRT